MFIVLKGENFNGNNYVVLVIEKGVVVVIIDEVKFKEEELGSKGIIIVVDNIKKVLGDLVRFYR